MQETSDFLEPFNANSLDNNDPMGGTGIVSIEKRHGSITDYPSGEMDLRLLSPAPLGATDWDAGFDDGALAFFDDCDVVDFVDRVIAEVPHSPLAV